MRVSPRDLRGIRAEGLLTRFAILGPVAFVSVELPAGGSSGTAIEKPTVNPAWGIVLNGSVSLHGPSEETFVKGTAFHVPAGPPPHFFTAPSRAAIAGFAPLPTEIDTSDAAIRALGFEPLARVPAPAAPPSVIAPAAGGLLYRTQGSIEVESAVMGEWIFSRTTYGPLSGYTSGWCDLAHWGMVLSGDLALRFENSVELLFAGDVYYCPSGPPGHQFQVADSATTIDYTPAGQLYGDGRKSDWRAASARRLAQGEAVTGRPRTGVRARRAAEPKAAPPEPKSSLHEASLLVSSSDRAARLGGTSRSAVQWVRHGLLRPAGVRS